MTRKEFNTFVSKVPERINSLSNELNLPKIAYSRTEIELIENWYRKKTFNTFDKNEAQIVFLTYIGEYLKSNCGGDWYFETNDNLVEYGQYTVLLYEDYGYCVCPMNWIEDLESLDETIAEVVNGILGMVEYNYSRYLESKNKTKGRKS